MEKFIISNSLRIKYNLGDISLGYGLENKGVTFFPTFLPIDPYLSDYLIL